MRLTVCKGEEDEDERIHCAAIIAEWMKEKRTCVDFPRGMFGACTRECLIDRDCEVFSPSYIDSKHERIDIVQLIRTADPEGVRNTLRKCELLCDWCYDLRAQIEESTYLIGDTSTYDERPKRVQTEMEIFGGRETKAKAFEAWKREKRECYNIGCSRPYRTGERFEHWPLNTMAQRTKPSNFKNRSAGEMHMELNGCVMMCEGCSTKEYAKRDEERRNRVVKSRPAREHRYEMVQQWKLARAVCKRCGLACDSVAECARFTHDGADRVTAQRLISYSEERVRETLAAADLVCVPCFQSRQS